MVSTSSPSLTGAFLLVGLTLVACSSEGEGLGAGGATGGGGHGGGASTHATSGGTAQGGSGGGGGGEPAAPSPEECEALTDEASCLAAGCSLYERFVELLVDEEGTCQYGDELFLCIVWPHSGVGVGTGALTGYFRVKDGVRQDIEAGAGYIGGLPGWNGCDSGDPAEAACACVPVRCRSDGHDTSRGGTSAREAGGSGRARRIPRAWSTTDARNPSR